MFSADKENKNPRWQSYLQSQELLYSTNEANGAQVKVLQREELTHMRDD